MNEKCMINYHHHHHHHRHRQQNHYHVLVQWPVPTFHLRDFTLDSVVRQLNGVYHLFWSLRIHMCLCDTRSVRDLTAGREQPFVVQAFARHSIMFNVLLMN